MSDDFNSPDLPQQACMWDILCDIFFVTKPQQITTSYCHIKGTLRRMKHLPRVIRSDCCIVVNTGTARKWYNKNK